MFRSAVKCTTDWLVQGGSISQEDREIYEFGLDKLFSILSNFIFMVGLGLFFGMFMQVAIFYIAYLMIRVYAGGYHAERSWCCFLMSNLVIIPCLLMIRFQQTWNVPIVFYSALILCTAILLLLGPTGSKNKMLDEEEKKVYGRRLMRNLVIVVAMALILFFVGFDYYVSAVLCGILLATTAAIIGKMKLLFQGREEKQAYD